VASYRTIQDALAVTAAIVRSRLKDLPAELLDPAAKKAIYDLIVVLPREAEFGLAQVSLDMLATVLCDWFGSMQLQPPAESPSEVILHGRIGAPDAEPIRLLVESALEALMIEFLGAEVSMVTAVVRKKTTVR
jgi:hypothetical protein